MKAFDNSVMAEAATALRKPKDLHLTPAIDNVATAPSTGRIEPDTVLMIMGRNFGDKPGQIYLSVETRRETPSTEFRKEDVVTETVELVALRPNWTNSWFSNLVLARAPVTFKDPLLEADRDGILQLVLPDGSKATATITVGSGSPRIYAVKTRSGDGWIRPDEEFTVSGRNFGDAPGGTVIFGITEPGTHVAETVARHRQLLL